MQADSGIRAGSRPMCRQFGALTIARSADSYFEERNSSTAKAAQRGLIQTFALPGAESSRKSWFLSMGIMMLTARAVFQPRSHSTDFPRTRGNSKGKPAGQGSFALRGSLAANLPGVGGRPICRRVVGLLGLRATQFAGHDGRSWKG